MFTQPPGMEEFDLPEIQRTSLTSVALTLKTLGVDNVLDFPYLDPPDERRLLEALKQLYYFDALDREGRVTALGKQMGRLPLTPSLSRVLLGEARRVLRCAPTSGLHAVCRADLCSAIGQGEACAGHRGSR